MKAFFTNGETWLRLVFILLFYYLFAFVFLVATLTQFGFILCTGKMNERLLDFSQQFSIYTYQVCCYVSHNSDEKPFPFSKWPHQ